MVRHESFLIADSLPRSCSKEPIIQVAGAHCARTGRMMRAQHARIGHMLCLLMYAPLDSFRARKSHKKQLDAFPVVVHLLSMEFAVRD